MLITTSTNPYWLLFLEVDAKTPGVGVDWKKFGIIVDPETTCMLAEFHILRKLGVGVDWKEVGIIVDVETTCMLAEFHILWKIGLFFSSLFKFAAGIEL